MNEPATNVNMNQKAARFYMSRGCWARVLLAFFSAVLNGECPAPAAAQDRDVPPTALSGISVSQTYDIADGGPLGEEEPVMVKVLYRAGKSSLENFDRYAEYSAAVSYPTLMADPQPYRMWTFRLSGHVKSLRWHRFESADAETPVKGVYIATLKPDGSVRPTGNTGLMTIVTRTVPEAWVNAVGKQKLRDGETVMLNQPSGGMFFFYRLVNLERRVELETEAAAAEDKTQTAVFIGDRLNWFPNRADSEFGVSQGQKLLGLAGVDVGRFDDVKRQHNSRLQGADAECFYQMLAAMNKIDPDDYAKAGLASPPAEFLDLVSNPRGDPGRLVSVSGRVRRCVPIEINNSDVRKRLGVDRYYELDMFVPIDAKISIDTESGEKLIYENRFPVTVCVMQLPKGVTPETISNEQIDVSAFFFRFWRYQNEFAAASGSSQVSPLVIGLSPAIVPQTTQLFDNIFKYGLLTMLGGAIWMVWYYRRVDRNNDVRIPGLAVPREELPEKIELNSIDLDAVESGSVDLQEIEPGDPMIGNLISGEDRESELRIEIDVSGGDDGKDRGENGSAPDNDPNFV